MNNLSKAVSVISLHDISCEKQDRQLFSGLSVTVDAGNLLFIKGENGAGKTSLLRIIVGLSQPQSGQVMFMGECIKQRPDILHNLIYIGHKSGNSPTLSALDNLRFWTQQRQLNIHDDLILDVLHMLQLDGLEELPVRQLSAGQQRRVSLARLWLHKTAKLWVLDEPFTALDVDAVRALCEHISEFVVQQGCVIMTSHQSVDLTCKQTDYVLEYCW